MFRVQRRCRDFSFSATMPILFVSVNDAETCSCFRFQRRCRLLFPSKMTRLLSFPGDNAETSFFSGDDTETFISRRLSVDDAETFNFLRRCRDFFHFPSTMPRPFHLGDDAETFLFRRRCRDFSFPAMITIL